MMLFCVRQKWGIARNIGIAPWGIGTREGLWKGWHKLDQGKAHG